MMPLARILVGYTSIGLSILSLFVSMLFWHDIAGLRSLVAVSLYSTFAAAALTFLLCLTFNGIRMGIRVMQLNRYQRGGRIRFTSVSHKDDEGEPVRVRVSSRLRRH